MTVISFNYGNNEVVKSPLNLAPMTSGQLHMNNAGWFVIPKNEPNLVAGRAESPKLDQCTGPGEV